MEEVTVTQGRDCGAGAWGDDDDDNDDAASSKNDKS